ncbi:ABC Superfamily [Phytophthora palmivora]|uniref:ABC Superfamily n=1 Tax=Phytophthora palmivora TaxID=4796 RepID=A0A2P4YJK1_9STRA|nr:ABC Superfamily [Phytophthora palmivora]
MITGSKSEEDTTGSTKDPTPPQDGPLQNAPVDDSISSEAKAAPASSPAKNLTLDEGKARAQAAKAAPQNRADEGAATAKKRAAPGSPTSEPSIAKGFKSLFDSELDEAEEEGAIIKPQEISNGLDEQQERYQADQLQGASEVASSAPAPVYPRGYYPPYAGSGSTMFLEHLKAPRGLNHGSTSRGAYERASVQDEPLFVNDIEAARPQQPLGSQPGDGLPAPTSSVTRDNPATSQAAGASQSAAALGRPAPHGSGARRPDQGGQEELSHAFDDEVRQLRDRVYAIEIALGMGLGGHAAAQAGKPGGLEVHRQDVDARVESSTGVLTAVFRLPP